MSFRQKLLLVFSMTVFVSVVAVAWIVSAVTRRAFARADGERTAALASQFHHEFNRRGEDVVGRVETIAAGEAATRMALALSRGAPDYGAFLNEAKIQAESRQLDFLEFVDAQNTIISSAQWPAKFGYKASVSNLPELASKNAFLKLEELPERPALGLFAVRPVNVGDKPFYVIGGRLLDQELLASIELPAGMRALLYQNLTNGFSAQNLIAPVGNIQDPSRLASLIGQVQKQASETVETVHWSSDPADDEIVVASPLKGGNGQLLGVLLLANSRRGYVELGNRIRSAALLVGGAGVVLAILLSGWAAARVTRPVEKLAESARQVAAGNWNTRVEVTSTDELGELADSFNRMTRELLDQRERLVQSERVAAWRELARRLAHELKNPLFPLQLTVENLVRAREQSPEQFEEILQESSSTLLAEIANLKAIVSRFNEFSRMPQPQFQPVQINEVVRGAARLLQTPSPARPRIDCRLELAEGLPPIAADPELLHRAISNLALNAMDAMPQGGTLTLRTSDHPGGVRIEVADTGLGLTPEECERLFTPYYTTKQHGTGLGLAIAQSVVSDHGGKISVRSEPGRSTTFAIELPRNQDKLKAAAEGSSGARA